MFGFFFFFFLLPKWSLKVQNKIFMWVSSSMVFKYSLSFNLLNFVVSKPISLQFENHLKFHSPINVWLKKNNTLQFSIVMSFHDTFSGLRFNNSLLHSIYSIFYSLNLFSEYHFESISYFLRFVCVFCCCRCLSEQHFATSRATIFKFVIMFFYMHE